MVKDYHVVQDRREKHRATRQAEAKKHGATNCKYNEAGISSLIFPEEKVPEGWEEFRGGHRPEGRKKAAAAIKKNWKSDEFVPPDTMRLMASDVLGINNHDRDFSNYGFHVVADVPFMFITDAMNDTKRERLDKEATPALWSTYFLACEANNTKPVFL